MAHHLLLGMEQASRGLMTGDDLVTDQDFARGRGYFNEDAPRGRYPLAVRFTLAQGGWSFDGVPPGAVRTRPEEYVGVPVESGLGR